MARVIQIGPPAEPIAVFSEESGLRVLFSGILQTAKHRVIAQCFGHHLNKRAGPDVPGRIAIAGGIHHGFIDLSRNLRGLR